MEAMTLTTESSGAAAQAGDGGATNRQAVRRSRRVFMAVVLGRRSNAGRPIASVVETGTA